MITPARKFLCLLVIAVVLNIATHIFYFVQPTKQNSHKKNSSKHHDIFMSMNWKILYDNIICNNTLTRELTETNLRELQTVPLHNAANSTNHTQTEKEDMMYKLCPLVAPGLGPVAKDKAIMNLHGIDDMYLRIEAGGIHSPSDCIARQQVAIIVAVHETDNSTRRHVGSFIYYIHPFLMKQQLEYQVFVVLKKNTTSPYERGKLFNIGYVEAQTYRGEGWDCIVFHDAHLVPLDTRNLYRCSEHPRRLIADFRTPFRFGGAVAISPHNFSEINGFSNLIWSDDGDYIDMYNRLITANFTVEGNIEPIGNYATFEYLLQLNTKPVGKVDAPSYKQDGLSNLFYDVSEIQLKQFYTLIEVGGDESQKRQYPL